MKYSLIGALHSSQKIKIPSYFFQMSVWLIFPIQFTFLYGLKILKFNTRKKKHWWSVLHLPLSLIDIQIRINRHETADVLNTISPHEQKNIHWLTFSASEVTHLPYAKIHKLKFLWIYTKTYHGTYKYKIAPKQTIKMAGAEIAHHCEPCSCEIIFHRYISYSSIVRNVFLGGRL